MSRVVTYLTDRASDLRVNGGLQNAFHLFLACRASIGNIEQAREQMNYALESPCELPCGGCEHDEIYTGDEEESGMPSYAVMAQQITVRREE